MWRTPPVTDNRSIFAAGLHLIWFATGIGLILLPFLNVMRGMTDGVIGFLLVCLLYSSVSLAIPLAVMLPLAIYAARRGWAGWAVAVLGGGGFGGMLGLLWGTMDIFLASLGLGIVLGGIYWLILRLRAPHVFGVYQNHTSRSGN